MHASVPLTLSTTGPTGRGAGFELRAEDGPVGLGLAGDEPTGRVAHVRAVQVEPDAADKHRQVLLLTKAGISASRTGLSAVETGLDAGLEQAHINPRLPRVGLEHLSCVHDRLLEAVPARQPAIQLTDLTGL